MITTSPTITDLKQQTRSFLALHWDEERIGVPPTWSKLWRFQGGIPNHELSGCYALLKGDQVVYIGSGVGKGKTRYKGSGLGGRLQNYCSRDFSVKAKDLSGRRYKPTARAVGITALITLGFEVRYWYMACALEAFLIDSLRPQRNAVGKRWVVDAAK